MTAAVPVSGGRHGSITLLLRVSDAIAAILLAADLVVVCASVLLRFFFNAPVEWSDDVARGLMVGSAFFGAASALARGENVGVSFFRDLLPVRLRTLVDAASALLIVLISGYVAYNAIKLGSLTAGQTTGSGLPLELTFYPMGVGALFMLAALAGGAAGPWVTGFLYDRAGDYTLAFGIAILVSGLSALAIWQAAPRKVRAVAGQLHRVRAGTGAE